MYMLVTGGAGFIGNHFIKYILRNTNYFVINLDNLTYAGNNTNLTQIINNKRYRFIKGNIVMKNW